MVARAHEDRWYVRNGDHVDGPHTTERLRLWHAEGRLPDDVLISRDGLTWHRVRWPERKATARRRRR